MSEEEKRVLNAYRDTSIYTVNALKAEIEGMERAIASNRTQPAIKGLIRERMETLQINLDIIELDPE